MKTYKHKTLGWIAEPAKDDDVRVKELLTDKYDIFAYPDSSYINNYRVTAEELVALGFKEVVEKDWIDKVISIMETNILDRSLSDRGKEKIREAIEEHAPKQKMFTIEECVIWADKKSIYSWNGHTIAYFLKEHNLLSSD